jgi:hypothetical protein
MNAYADAKARQHHDQSRQRRSNYQVNLAGHATGYADIDEAHIIAI